MHDGITRDFLKRYFIARDQFWWKTPPASPWQLDLIHPWARPGEDPATHQVVEPYHVSEWRDRVLDLCEYDITQSCFGMGFKDLIDLDPATFEEIEERVHDIAEKRNKTSETLAETSKTNLLKEPRK